jgi:elongation factor G
VPLQLPIGAEAEFAGIVDIVTMRAFYYMDDLGNDIQERDIPDDMLEMAKEQREILLEAVAEHDEVLMEKYLDGDELTIDEIKACIRRATTNVEIIPVLCGSAYKNKGVQKLLDAIIDYMPSPLDVATIEGVSPDTEETLEMKPDDDGPFSALAFKIMADPFVGKLCFFRVYSGTLKAGSYIYNSSKGKKERIGRIVLMHANHREDADAIYSGDIAAAVGLKQTSTGDTLCEQKTPVILESMDFPEPVISIAIEPKTKAGQEKMIIALQKLSEEDPTFKTKIDKETGQTIISGMGELHLEIIVDRMLREFKVEANIGKPQVSYKETIKKKVQAEGRFVRQSGGRGQFGHCNIELEPLEPGSGYIFEDKIVGGAIPKEYISAVKNGILESMSSGVLGGYQMIDIKATLYDGSYHEVDSSEMAFKIAGSMAFKNGAKKASPVLLEPIMRIDIVVPEDYMGDVMGDLNSRRGRIEGMETRAKAQVITANVPLSEMFGYATELRSRTQGRGTFTMQFSHYDIVPKSIEENILN